MANGNMTPNHQAGRTAFNLDQWLPTFGVCTVPGNVRFAEPHR